MQGETFSYNSGIVMWTMFTKVATNTTCSGQLYQPLYAGRMATFQQQTFADVARMIIV